jgi:hypothetical protein
LYKLCVSYFVVPETATYLQRLNLAGIKNVGVQFILLSYDSHELAKFEDICRRLPKGTIINLHPNSFPFNSLNFAEREENIRQYFVNFVLLWVPKFIKTALNNGCIVQNIVLHAGFQVTDCDISSKENIYRREEALQKVISSYQEISPDFEKYDCTLTFENGVRAETTLGRILSNSSNTVQAFELPYTFDEIKYLVNNSVNITFDIFKYFETLNVPEVETRIDITLDHLQYFLTLGRVLDIQISSVQARPEGFSNDLIFKVKDILRQAQFSGSLTLEGYWNMSLDRLANDLKDFSC